LLLELRGNRHCIWRVVLVQWINTAMCAREERFVLPFMQGVF
jgi:hypothetical protein